MNVLPEMQSNIYWCYTVYVIREYDAIGMVAIVWWSVARKRIRKVPQCVCVYTDIFTITAKYSMFCCCRWCCCCFSHHLFKCKQSQCVLWILDSCCWFFMRFCLSFHLLSLFFCFCFCFSFFIFGSESYVWMRL